MTSYADRLHTYLQALPRDNDNGELQSIPTAYDYERVGLPDAAAFEAARDELIADGRLKVPTWALRDYLHFVPQPDTGLEAPAADPTPAPAPAA